MAPSRPYAPSAKENFPGPGQYDRAADSLSRAGRYFLSKHEDSRCRTFARSDHRGTLRKVIEPPGPTTYNYFSEFGAKNK
jgi:hypothetical protein